MLQSVVIKEDPINEEEKVGGYTFNDLPVMDSLEVTPDNLANKLKKQYIYDAKLNCYYDPHTNEYFEMKN